ncbi:hypothetical protein J6590_040772 [Homalodisca vitripennis]|nr:hypothetical protein J6590_040772 [Homalodisca vitripennis]
MKVGDKESQVEERYGRGREISSVDTGFEPTELRYRKGEWKDDLEVERHRFNIQIMNVRAMIKNDEDSEEMRRAKWKEDVEVEERSVLLIPKE